MIAKYKNYAVFRRMVTVLAVTASALLQTYVIRRL